MPRYMDFHAKMTLSKDQEDDIRKSLGTTDNNGVRQIDAYVTKDGQGYCLTEAPNADAVCKTHAAHGVQLNRVDVHEIARSLV